MTKMTPNKKLGWTLAGLLMALAMLASPRKAAAQDQSDDYDPPGIAARLGYMEGSVSFQPAGETEWVQAVSNRPMTTGDRIWADQQSRAEVQVGSSAIRMGENTGFSFLNLDDRTTQIELTAGSLNISVRRLDRDEVFEVDTPNQAFVVYQPGRYRIEASEDGNYTVVSVRDGEGESTGNGQNYSLHAGQRWTFTGTDQLTAEVDQIAGADQFDNWSYARERRYTDSRSAQYVSRDVVGYDDLDDYGDWRDDREYGHVWFPNRVSSGWAPYQEGHWDWISPWGWTWVDDSPWGYAPFHYGRWVTIGGRWGWIAGPPAVRPVYAPALVVFLGFGGGGNVGWFPLGPREVYIPSYRVSRGYVDRVNVSNTTVNTTTITNVYNTTIINNNTTNITNIKYVNRTAQNAVTAVPQRTFASAQPVGKARVQVNAQQVSAAPVSARVQVAPTRESVLGARANTANRVTAPPAAVANRKVIAKNTPPPPPVPFAKQQQALQQHPGQPLAKREVQTLRPTQTAEAHPMVKLAPPGKPTAPNKGNPGNQPNRPGNQPANAAQPNENRPNANPAGTPDKPGNRPDNRPAPNERPAQPGNRPDANRPDANRPNPNRPEPNQPDRPDANRPNQPDNNRPDANRPNPNRPEPNQPDANRPNRPDNNRPDANRPDENRPNANRPEPNQPDRPDANRPNRPNANKPDNNRPDANPPNANRPDAKPEANQPDAKRPDENRPNANRPDRAEPNRPERPQPNAPDNQPDRERPNGPPAKRDRPPSAQPNRPDQNAQPDRREQGPPPETAPPSRRPPPADAKPQTPAEKKQEQDRKKREQKQQEEKPPQQ